jgi:sugar phosphate isomerase/epimerase
MNLLDRIGIDIGRRLSLEDAIDWAAKNNVKHIDIQLDTAANAITSFDDARCANVRAALERNGVHLALHTLSMSRSTRPTSAKASKPTCAATSTSFPSSTLNGSSSMPATTSVPTKRCAWTPARNV